MKRLPQLLLKLQILSDRLYKVLPMIYLIYALSAIALAAFITPPFQTPDEPNHFCRAEQVSRGKWLAVFHTTGEKPPRTIPDKRVLMPDIGGYTVNRGIGLAYSFYANLPFNSKAKVWRSQVDSSKKVGWDMGDTDGAFPNTAIYPPTGYIASAIGIIMGKIMRASIIRTLYISRCLNGLICVVICFYALQISKRSRLLLFTVLLFPMIISLFASVSQDGILISLACLFFAIIEQVEGSVERRYSRKQLIMMVAALVALGAAKPPYFILGFIFFFLSLDKRTKLTCFLTAFLSTGLWGILNQRNYAVVWAPPDRLINAGLQSKSILAHPLEFVRLFFKIDLTVIREVMYEFIGVLGWQDLTLPNFFYRGAVIALVFSALISINYFVKDRLRIRSALVLLTVVCFIAIMTIQYITWMPLEAPYLGGVQGRYFIPVFPAVAIALAGFKQDIKIKKWQTLLFFFVLILPFIDGIVVVDQLIGRYYLRE